MAGEGEVMTNAYVLTGTLTDPQTVRLSEPLPVGTGEVRVTVEVVQPTTAEPAWKAVMEKVWEEQRQRGHVPPTAEEVVEYIRGERDSWGD
jgi:uncharacterized membrane protein